MFDKDGNGFISLQEMQEAFSQNDTIGASELKNMMRDVDPNGDGEVSYEEFVDLMLQDYILE